MRAARLARTAARLCLLAAAGCGLAGPKSSSEGKWVRAVRQDLVFDVELTGTLKAVDSSRLGPPVIPDVWEFKISFLAPEGAEVRRGQPVLGFDSTALARELEQRTAEGDTARAEIEKTQADLRIRREKDEISLAEAQARLRKTQLKLDVPVDLVGANDRRSSELDRELAEREVAHLTQKLESSERVARERIAGLSIQERRALGRVAEIRSQIERMTVRAPRDGTVIYIADWRGEKRKVGDMAWRQRPLVEIPDLARMTAEAEVDESDAGKVAVGQVARFRLDAHPDDELTGRVQSLSKAVVRQSPRNPLKVLRLEIHLDRTDPKKMRPGMRLRGSIETGRVRNAVVIPLGAVFPGPAGPLAYTRGLWSVRSVPLSLGARSSRFVQVRRGVGNGDWILLRGPSAPPGTPS